MYKLIILVSAVGTILTAVSGAVPDIVDNRTFHSCSALHVLRMFSLGGNIGLVMLAAAAMANVGFQWYSMIKLNSQSENIAVCTGSFRRFAVLGILAFVVGVISSSVFVHITECRSDPSIVFLFSKSFASVMVALSVGSIWYSYRYGFQHTVAVLPGAGALRAIEFCCGRRAIEEVFAPIVGDIRADIAQQERDARFWNARVTLVIGYVELSQAVAWYAIGRLQSRMGFK